MAKFEEEKRKGAPDWITTFADMMSLLLTFFVFILTFSTIETEKYQKARGSLRGAFGIAPDTRKLPQEGATPPPRIDRVPQELPGPEAPPDRELQEIEEIVRAAVRRVTEEDGVFDVERVRDGIRILPASGVFDPSAAALSARWSRMVRNVADVLAPLGRSVVVRAFTDRDFLSTPEFPSPETMETERALRVATELEAGGLPARSIRVRGGLRREYPYPNETARDRARNRTFEIVVTSDTGKD